VLLRSGLPEAREIRALFARGLSRGAS
jgi:hypothetical protein